MEIGVMMGAGGEGQTLEDLVDVARGVEAAGLDTVWMANIFSFDAINALSLIGSKTSTLKLGTAVVPTYPRHPTAMAQQALTAAAATDNRFTLGIGLSHQIVIEGMLGMSYAQPAKHMQEYLSVLVPLLNKEMVNHAGENYTVRNTQIDVPGANPVSVVVAALGPRMLKIAGELADGTNTWMVGPRTMETHIVKNISAAAEGAGRPAPRVVAGVPVGLTMSRTNCANRPRRISSSMVSYRAIEPCLIAKVPPDQRTSPFSATRTRCAGAFSSSRTRVSPNSMRRF